MTAIESAIAEYQSALEANMYLSQQETAIKSKRTAARHRLNMAKDELRALEMDITSNLNTV